MKVIALIGAGVARYLKTTPTPGQKDCGLSLSCSLVLSKVSRSMWFVWLFTNGSCGHLMPAGTSPKLNRNVEMRCADRLNPAAWPTIQACRKLTNEPATGHPHFSEFASQLEVSSVIFVRSQSFRVASNSACEAQAYRFSTVWPLGPIGMVQQGTGSSR